MARRPHPHDSFYGAGTGSSLFAATALHSLTFNVRTDSLPFILYEQDALIPSTPAIETSIKSGPRGAELTVPQLAKAVSVITDAPTLRISKLHDGTVRVGVFSGDDVETPSEWTIHALKKGGLPFPEERDYRSAGRANLSVGESVPIPPSLVKLWVETRDPTGQMTLPAPLPIGADLLALQVWLKSLETNVGKGKRVLLSVQMGYKYTSSPNSINPPAAKVQVLNDSYTSCRAKAIVATYGGTTRVHPSVGLTTAAVFPRLTFFLQSVVPTVTAPVNGDAFQVHCVLAEPSLWPIATPETWADLMPAGISISEIDPVIGSDIDSVGDGGVAWTVDTGLRVLGSVHPVASWWVDIEPGTQWSSVTDGPLGMKTSSQINVRCYEADFPGEMVAALLADGLDGSDLPAGEIITQKAAVNLAFSDASFPVNIKVFASGLPLNPRLNILKETAMSRVCELAVPRIDLRALDFDSDDTWGTVANRANALSRRDPLGFAWIETRSGLTLVNYAEVATVFSTHLLAVQAAPQAHVIAIEGAKVSLLRFGYMGTTTVLATYALPQDLVYSSPTRNIVGQVWHEMSLMISAGADLWHSEAGGRTLGTAVVPPVDAAEQAPFFLGLLLTMHGTRTLEMIASAENAARTAGVYRLLTEAGHPDLVARRAGLSLSRLDLQGPLALGFIAERAEKLFFPLWLTGAASICGPRVGKSLEGAMV